MGSSKCKMYDALDTITDRLRELSLNFCGTSTFQDFSSRQPQRPKHRDGSGNTSCNRFCRRRMRLLGRLGSRLIKLLARGCTRSRRLRVVCPARDRQVESAEGPPANCRLPEDLRQNGEQAGRRRQVVSRRHSTDAKKPHKASRVFRLRINFWLYFLPCVPSEERTVRKQSTKAHDPSKISQQTNTSQQISFIKGQRLEWQ